MFLEEKINKLNQNAKSSLSLNGVYASDSRFQQSCYEKYLQFLALDDESKIGYRSENSRIITKNEGEPTEAIVRQAQDTVWTNQGPLVREMEVGVLSQKGGQYDRFHSISLEGYFLMPCNPKDNIPPRYEYIHVNKSFYYNGTSEVATCVEGIAKVDDVFVPFFQAVEPRETEADTAFGIFERQFSSFQSVAQTMSVDIKSISSSEQLN